MIALDRAASYRKLLEIHHSARKRDATLMGAVFLIAFLATIAIGLVSGLGAREAYLVAAMDVVFGVLFLQAWVRLEIVKRNLELIDHLQIGNR